MVGEGSYFKTACEAEITRLREGISRTSFFASEKVEVGRTECFLETAPVIGAMQNTQLVAWKTVLEKINTGTVKLCNSCGEEIPPERLRLMLGPETRQRIPIVDCVKCHGANARSNLLPRKVGVAPPPI